MRIIFTFSAKDKKKSKNCGLIPTSKKFQQTRLATFDVLSWNELFLVLDCVTEVEDEDDLEAGGRLSAGPRVCGGARNGGHSGTEEYSH